MFPTSIILWMLSQLCLCGAALASVSTPQIRDQARLQDAFCRNVPGSAGFPTAVDFAYLNKTVSGRLVKVIPFAEFCNSLANGCTSEQFRSSVFRSGVPGALDQVNWEKDSDCDPASLTCSNQGNVPLFGILAESVADIQAGVNFARIKNLRLAIKASGHDYLGRSTAKHSLLISTHKLQNYSFSDDFFVGGKSLGPAITVGSGIPLNKLYQITKAQGRIVVGGTAASVVAAGGYVQGAGHSALSPTFGLAADNCLEIAIVLADGRFVKANSVENPDLFWAIRGGGAGSWGVIVYATFQTFPTFDAVISLMQLTSNTIDEMAAIATVHAKHIFDWDGLRAGQYFIISTRNRSNTTRDSGGGKASKFTMVLLTAFPRASLDQATGALAPFKDDISKIRGVSLMERSFKANINDALFAADDIVGENVVLGSRLIPASAYKNPELVGQVYSQLLKGGAQNILGHLVAGGKVSENANVSNAVHPAWRTAKTHIVLSNAWAEDASTDQVHGNQTFFAKHQLPILEQLSGKNAGAYSNEADTLEVDFRTTFFGSNYAKLSAIKAKFDPTDLFIVRAGVGSERWDSDGLCRIYGA